MKTYLRDLPDSDVIDNKTRLSSSDYFELVYMRHNYFRNSTNPAPGRLESFEEMLCNITYKIYYRNMEVFKDVGFELEDLQNIARVHTVSFISMDGLYENEEKMKKFIKRHKKTRGAHSEPDKQDIFRKECYNLAKFLNQRIQEVAMFCGRKNQNIRGSKNKIHYLVGKPLKAFTNEDIVKYPKEYGFNKITKREYKKLQLENNPKDNNIFKTKDNEIVKVVHMKGEYLTKKDMYDIGINPEQNMFYSNPEDNLLYIEHENEIEEKLRELKK